VIKYKKIVALGDSKSHFPLNHTATATGGAVKNLWLALPAVKIKYRAACDKNLKNSVLVELYELARTHFATK
jgi:hypothetical protein